MKYINITDTWPHEVVNEIGEYCELSNYQKYQLRRWVEDYCPFKIVKYGKEPKTSFWWRLTYPLLIVFLLLLVIIKPFMWLITGSQYYKDGNWTFKLINNWCKKVGI